MQLFVMHKILASVAYWLVMAAGTVLLNRLLAALSREDWERMRPSFEEIILNQKVMLLDAGDRLEKVHFPTAGVVSSIAAFQGGAVAEMATVGREGVVEIGAVLGGDSALARYIVQVPGAALAIEYRAFRRWEQEIPAFRQVLLRYAQAYFMQVSQSVACNAIHPAQERAARWLLTCRDRSDGDSFALTQEFLAEMLGVTRPVVNTIARTLQRVGLISYNRGIVTIIDRPGLEEAACECYRLMRGAYESRSIGPR